MEKIIDKHKIKIGIGWDPKKSGKEFKGAWERTIKGMTKEDYDLNVGCIVDYYDGRREMVFFGHKYNKERSVIYEHGDRTGTKQGINEEMTVYLSKATENTKRFVFFMDIYHGKILKHYLADVDNVFAQIFSAHTLETYVRADEIFKSEEAKESTAFVFGEIVRVEEGGWKVRTIDKFLKTDKAIDFFNLYKKSGHSIVHNEGVLDVKKSDKDI